MSTYVDLASSVTAGGIIGVIVGVVIVAALVIAFVRGARRKQQEPPPPLQPPQGPDNPDPHSWSEPPGTPGATPESEGRR